LHAGGLAGWRQKGGQLLEIIGSIEPEGEAPEETSLNGCSETVNPSAITPIRIRYIGSE
jgi:hypothetical protein